MFNIVWGQFTPYSAIGGGALIGAAAGALALGGGKIAGISGIFGGTLQDAMRKRRPANWRVAFLLGLVASSLVWALFRPVPGAYFGESWPIIAIGGVLVGFGTRLGSGCASGHGVCGLARISPRSMVAVATFLGMGILTTVLLHNLP